MALEQLNEYLRTHSYLGSPDAATLEDYTRCKAIAAGDIDADALPHLNRWHQHISHLIQEHPTTDWRGEPLPAGTAPDLSAAASDAAPAKGAKAKKEPKPKKEPAPKKESKKEAKTDAPAAEDPEKAFQAKLKKVIKEGGKRGVEIEGAGDMGGLQFFSTSVDCPEGDIDLLVQSMNAMNAESNPTEEERKGGSGRIGKMIFSAGIEQLAVVAYVPEAKQAELVCEEWIKAVLDSQGGVVVNVGKDICTGRVLADGDKGVFPLKIREPMIVESNNFLRKKGLFPEDDGDSDEMVFGDDDFPS